MWTILLEKKSEAFTKFKRLRSLVGLEAGEKIQTFRTDRGGEFTSTEFNVYCKNAGIKRHLTAPYTPQQNGVVERRNKTLLEMTRNILKYMDIPNYFWGEAIRHSTYLLNRIATRALKDRTPYELFHEKKPNITHLRIFGCIGYAKIEKTQLRKLDDRSNMLVNFGTKPGSKAYRLYDPQTHKIVVSRDVIFDELRSWDWSETDREQRQDESFKLTLGTYGNRGLQDNSST